MEWEWGLGFIPGILELLEWERGLGFIPGILGLLEWERGLGFIPRVPKLPEPAAGSGMGFHNMELQRRGQSGKGRTTLLGTPLRYLWIALGNLWHTPGKPLGHP